MSLYSIRFPNRNGEEHKLSMQANTNHNLIPNELLEAVTNLLDYKAFVNTIANMLIKSLATDIQTWQQGTPNCPNALGTKLAHTEEQSISWCVVIVDEGVRTFVSVHWHKHGLSGNGASSGN